MAITDDERKRRDREKHNKLWREDPGYRDRSLQYKAKRYAANPEPAKAYAAEWRAAHPGYNLRKARSSRYTRTYGVSPKDYDDMFAAQDGACARAAHAIVAWGNSEMTHGCFVKLHYT
jgi:hypothetical protein